MKYAMATLAGLLGLASPSVARADDATVHLILHGGADAETVRAQLQAELGADVALVRGACGAPCVDVSIDGTTATVLFSPRQGLVRERTVELGTDDAQWPTILTLLAGNLVRDEAADVLAQLPSRELPVPSTAQIVIPPLDDARAPRPAPVPSRPFSLGLVPLVGTDLTGAGQIRHHVSIDLIAGYSAGSTGLAIAGAVDVERGPVSGFQIAGALGYARSVSGTQVGGAATVAGDLHGVQIAGAVAVADRSQGAQIAGALAVSRGTANVQVAGALAVADRVTGAQVAPINVARRVDGVQVGVVNIGGGNDGISLGLINIVRGGRTDVEAAVDSDGLGTVMLRHGSRRWHNVYGVAGEHFADAQDTGGGSSNNDAWMYGLGFGPTWHAFGGTLDVDAICWHVQHGHHWDNHLALLNQARITYAHPLGPVSVVVGAAYNVFVSSDHTSPIFLQRHSGAAMDTGVSTLLWPTAFVGIRL